MSDVVGGAAVIIIPDVSGFADALTAALGPALDSAQSLATNTAGEISSTLEGALASIDFNSMLQPIVPEIDTTMIVPDIDSAVTAADAVVAPEVDTTEIASGIDSAIASVQGESVEIGVIADTTQAQTAINDLGSDASGAGAAVGDLADQTGALSTAAGLASGELDSVGGVTKTLGDGMNAAVEGSTNLVEKLGVELPEAAGVLTTALASVTAGLGIIGGFTDLVVGKATKAQSATERFNLILGDSADKLEHVNIGGFNESLADMTARLGSGASAVRQADASIFELGLNTGSSRDQIEQTAEQINVLATRAVALKPSLGDVGDVADRMQSALARGGRFASNFGLALSSTEINARAMELAMARGSTQVEQFDKIAAGAQLSTEKLGASLKTDIEAGSENVEFSFKRIQREFNAALVALGKPLISPTLDILKSAIPIGIEFANILGEISADALPIVSSLVHGIEPLVKIVSKDLIGALKELRPVVDSISREISDALADPATVQSVKDLSKATADTVKALGPLLPLLMPIGDELKLVAGFAEDAAISMNNVIGPLLAIEDKAYQLGFGIARATHEQDIAAQRRDYRIQQIRHEADATEDLTTKTTDMAGAFFAAGDRAFNSLDGLNFLTLGIENLAGASDDQLKAIANRLGLNADSFSKWSKDVLGFVDQVVSGAQSALPKIADAFSLNGEQIVDPKTIEFQLKNQAQKVQDFQKDIEILHARGLDNLVNQLLTEGPVIGAGLADALVKGQPAQAQALEDQLVATKRSFDALTDYVRNEFGPKFAAETGMAAHSASVAFGTGLSTEMLAEVRVVGAAVIPALHEVITPGLTQAKDLGHSVGVAIDDGLIAGVSSKAALVGAAVSSLAQSVADAARVAWDSHSPSRVFAGIGADAVAGLALGLGTGHGDVHAAMADLMGSVSSVDLGGALTVGGGGQMYGPGAGEKQGGGGNVFEFNIVVSPPVGMTDKQAKQLGESIVTGAADTVKQMELRAAIYGA